jgi:hypothetical protein
MVAETAWKSKWSFDGGETDGVGAAQPFISSTKDFFYLRRIIKGNQQEGL